VLSVKIRNPWFLKISLQLGNGINEKKKNKKTHILRPHPHPPTKNKKKKKNKKHNSEQ